MQDNLIVFPEPPPDNTVQLVAPIPPVSLTQLVGREQEVQALKALLLRPDVRLLTLTGTAGVGKTRLALEAARELVHDFADGVHFVSLAPLSDSALVIPTIAYSMGLMESGSQPVVDLLKTSLRDKQRLLVLDNFEQVIEAAPLLTELLEACLDVKILVTSREVLRLRAEYQFSVPPLALPDPQRLSDTGSLAHVSSVNLFLQRAQAIQADFHVTTDNAEAIATICLRLDGLPLAIELAAARIKLLPPQALLTRLNHRLYVLTEGPRDLPLRQQTLRNTLAWSYELLTEQEQCLFERLSVFVDGCTLEAAEAICSAPGNTSAGVIGSVLDGVASLIDQSLVQQQPQRNGEPRLVMLETIREYGLEVLASSGEVEAVREAHATYYLALAEQAEPQLSGPQQEAWFARLEAEYDNLRVALGWAIDTGRTEEAARLALALWRFWHTRTYQREGVRWLERILALDVATPLSPALRPQLFNALGVLSLYQFDRAMSYHTEALRLWRALDDRAGMAQALFDIGWQQFDEMKLDQARKSARESLALARMVESPPAIARALLLDGLAATESDLVEEAIPVLEESLTLLREMGDTGNMALAMSTLARAEGKRGNDERAKPLLRDAVGLLVQQGNFISLIGPLVALGFMALHSEVQPEGAAYAAQIFGMMATWAEKVGGATPWSEEPMRRSIEQVTATLGADAFAQAFEIGKQMTPADLVQLAEQITAPTPQTILPPPPHPAPVHSRLSPREMDVLRLLAQGLTSAQIAEQLVIGLVTVNSHVRSIYSKLGVTSRSAATRYALEHKLV